MDFVELALALVAGFVGGLATRIPRFRRHRHRWNGSNGKVNGVLMQRCLVSGCKAQRAAP